MKTTGKAPKSLHIESSGFGKKFVILWVLASFLVSNSPAYASREDRLDQVRADRHERREERLQLRAERMAERVSLPSLNNQIPQIKLAPIFQNVQNSNHLNALEQRRMERANLITAKREARATALQNRLSAVNQISNKTIQTQDSGRTRNINAGLKLDLSSAQNNIVLGQKLFSGDADSVTITVGGEEKTFTAGSKVTAAEYASILQTLNGGQTLTLDSKGTALGGKLDFETITSNGDNLKLSSLVIPEQVLAVGNFSKTSDVKLKGDLVNYGSIYALSNRDGGTKATIATTNLHNQEGGLISSVPNSSLGTDLAQTLDLKLRADDTLSNAGKIESSGDLTLSAGNVVVNGDSRGRSSSTASAVAANNLVIDAPVVSNSGLLAAQNGNVNFSAPVDANHDGSITVNNANGTIQALNGDINFRDASASTTEKFSTTVNGGDLLSQKLNVYGGDGAVNIHSQNITGGVTVKSGTAFVSAAASDLDIDELVTTGDPVTASGGNVNVGSITTSGNPYTVIAGGDITFDPSAVVNTSNGAGAGGNVILAAGANFTTGGGVYQITGGTAAGGGIYGNSNAQIITSGTSSAGNVQLVAFTGSGGGSGTIYLPTETVTANSGAGNNNATVTAIGSFIEIAGVTATGGNAATGGVILNSFGATVSGGNVVIDGTTGAQMGVGSFQPATSTANPGDILVGPISTTGTVALSSSNNLVIRGNANARGFSATAINDIGLDGSAAITSPNGITIVAGNNVYLSPFSAPSAASLNTDAAVAGAITVIGGALFTETAGTVSVSGIRGDGGYVDFNYIDILGISANSSAGAGGNINIASYGQVSINSVAGITASGSGANANGDITLVGAEGLGVYSVFVENNIVNNAGTGGGNFVAASSTPLAVTVSKTNGSVTGTLTGGSQTAGDIFIQNVNVRGSISANGGGYLSTGTLNGTSVTLGSGRGIDVGNITASGAVTATSSDYAVFANVTATGNAFNVTATGEVSLGTTNVGSLSVASSDDIVIRSNLTSPGGIALVASRSIYTNLPNLVISTASNAGGGDVIMAAGAAWSSTASTITVTGAGIGGSIDFFGQPLDTLTTRSLTGNNNGGDVTMVAFGGNVSTNTTTDIITGGTGTGSNGNVTMISNATGTALNLSGTINTTGGSTASGSVSLTTATAITSPAVVIQRASATTSSGDFSTPNPTLTNGAIQIDGAITVGSADIIAQAGSNLAATATLTSANGAINLRSGAFLDTATLNAGSGSIALTSTDNISLNGNLSARSGILLVSGHNVFPGSTGLSISTGGAGTSGDVTMIAGAAFTQNATSVTVTGASTTGGQIDFDFNDLSVLTTASTSGGGAGGDVTLVAFTGTDNSGRVLMDPTVGSLTTGGNGAGANGNLLIIAGATTGTGVLLRNVNTTGGAVTTGNVDIRTATPTTSTPVVYNKNGATLASGDFANAPVATDSSVTFNTITVASDADVRVNGGDIIGTSLVGGANSVLNINSTGNINITNAINLGTANITSTNDVTVSLSQGGSGSATISGDNVNLGNSTTGTLRVNGNFVGLNSITASSTTVTSTSDIALNASITSPGGILLVAGQDIYAAVAGINISSASASTNGGAISIIAGANFTQDLTTVTVTGASTTGGNIDFDFNNVGTISSRSTFTNGNGGAINLIAFDGTNDFSFVFTDSTTQILTGGSGTGSNGSVTVIGGGSANDVVFLGNIDTTGGNATTGNVYLAAGVPDTTPSVVLQKSNATISSGNFADVVTLNPANVTAGNITVSSDADVTLRAGALVDVGAVNGGANSVLTINAGTTTDLLSSTMGHITITSGSDVTIAGTINQGAAGSLDITSGGLTQVLQLTSGTARIASVGDLFIGGPVVITNSFVATSQGYIDLDNDITARGGIVLVAGRTISANTSNVVDLSTAGTGNSGDITLIAGAAFTQNGTTITVTGGSALGGIVDFDIQNVNTIDSRSTGGNGAGGDITLLAFAGSDPGTGQVFTAVETVINTGGNGSGANGSFTAIGNIPTAGGFYGAAIAGPLSTAGGAVNTGDVYIAAAQIPSPVSITKADASVSSTLTGGTVTPGYVFTGDITVANGADVTLRAGGDVDTDVVTAGANSVLNINAGGATTIESSNAGTVTITAGNFVTAGTFNQGGSGLLNITAGSDLSVDQINTGNARLSANGILILLNTVTASGSVVGLGQGGITLANDITAPGGILLVSGRDIAPTAPGVVDLSTSRTGNAGDITLIAGAAYTSDATNVTITGGSATGGGIDFDFNRVNTIDTRSTGGNGAGGDLTMIGFAGSFSGSGYVFTDTAGEIRTGGSGTGANGNVTVVAGNIAGFAVGLRGLVDTTGGAAGTGNVYAAAATPDTTPAVVIAKSSASITSGDFTTGAIVNGDSFVDNVIVGQGANITLLGGGFGSITDLTGGANSSILASYGGAIDTRDVSLGAGGNLSLLTNLFIRLNGDVSAPGGILMVAGTDIFSSVLAASISADSATGSAGDISLVAGATFTQNASDVTITGATATGGRIDFDAFNLASLTANSGGGNGAGGDITLVSLFGTNNTGEVFTDSTTVITAGGNGTGSNGTLTIVSAKNNGASGIFLNNSVTLSGGAQGTGAITLSTSGLPGSVTLAKATGSITAGTFLGGALTNTSINGNNLTVRGGAINIRSGDSVSFNVLDVSSNLNGNGGSIVVSTAGATALDLGGAFGNRINTLTAAGGAISGNGGSISATASGAGGINVSVPLNVGALEGNGGSVLLNATNGDLTFAGGTATINASAATSSATAHAGGSITLTGRNITGSNPFQLLANGVSGGNGGQISVTSTVGDINVGTGNGQFSASANGPNGVISFSATGAGGDINVLATGALSTSTVNLSSAQGTLVLNGNVTGSTAVNLTVAGANSITGTGTVSGGTLSVSAGTGATTLTTSVASLTLATNGNVTITENDDINLNAGTTGAGSLNLNATGDDITVGGNVTANGGITLTTTGAGTISGAGRLISTGLLTLNGGSGAININTDVATLAAASTGSLTIAELNNITLNAIAASSVDVTAGNGIAHGTGVIASGSVNLSALGGDIGASGNAILINNSGNPVALTADATGDIFITILGNSAVSLGATTGDDITLNSSGPITTTGDITATGTLDITTNSLTYPNNLTGDVINVRSQPGSGLVLDGGAGGTMTAPNGINLTATFGNLTLSGVQDWFGVTTLTAINAPGSQIIISSGADIEGHDEVVIISNGIDYQGGSLVGNPITIQNDYFTFANSVGDINLSTDLVFAGQNLAIIAAGNINITGTVTLLNLSDVGNSGDLFLVAGYNFTPDTGGQVISPVQFTLDGDQSVSGGSINLGAAAINLSSVNGSGGNLTAIATTGNTNAGTITLGSIDASSTNGAGGNVQIIGEGGVNVGSINAIGGTSTGTVELAVAASTIVGGDILVADGTVTGGSFQAGALTSGNMVFGNIDGSTVTLRGASAAANSISQTAATALSATSLNIFSGAGNVNLALTSVPVLNVSGGGSVIVNNNTAVTLGTLTGSALNLSLSSAGVITVPTAISGIGGLTLSGTAGVGLDAITLGGDVSTTTTISLTANGGADLTLANRTLTSSNVTLASTAGDVNVANTGIINASGTATVDAFDSFAVAGTITAGSVVLTSGDDIVTGDITGSITAPNGTFLTSTNGGIGVDANNRFITNSTNLLLRAGGGDVFVQNLSTAGVNVTDVSATGTVDLIVNGPVTLHDVTSGGGDIKVVQNGIGSLTVAANANLNSTEGDIILQNLDINKKTGKIIIDDGAQIKASGTTAGVGEVFIAMGPLPIPPYTDRKKPPKGVTITETGGAGVFLGKKGIDTRKETNIALNALNRDLVFSLSGKLNKKAIHVGSNVTITADPPGDIVPTSAGLSARASAGLNTVSAIAPLTETSTSAPATTAGTGLDSGILSGVNTEMVQTLNNSITNSLTLNTFSNAQAGFTSSELTSTGFTSSRLATDDSTKTSSLLLSEKSFTGTQDALSVIFGDETDDFGSVFVDAVLVSESLPKAVGPNSAASNSAAANLAALNSSAASPTTARANLAHNLKNGSAVFVPAHNMIVNTPHANISVAAGSVVLVVSSENGTAVYDLHDSKKEAVQVAFHDQKLALSPGRHMTISSTEKRCYADANQAESIFHRGVVSAKTAHGGSLFTSEFAVNTAIDCVPALAKLMTSNHPECAKVAARLTKTQAVILYVSQGAEEFQQHLKAQVTAMR
ncbi:hypothetical protein KF728_16140 [Candidatus Obscuribacterales bacterium]|nr:hypothetical protein [Candidatus Obscuribacterales bacterium]